MRKFIAIKEKVSLYSNQITFNYNQKCHPLYPRDTWCKQFPKKKRREKDRKEVEKRRRRKGMERVCAEEKGKGRMRWQKRGKEGEGEERRERERGTENGENGARGALPSPDAFPSAKLGNNMTPIKGRLWKNTNPTSRSPTKPKQNLQVDPKRRRSSLEVSSRASLIYTP